MLHRECEVRIREARHLLTDSPPQRGRAKPLISGVYVLVSHGGVHVSTEVCRDVERPAWQRVAYFRVVLTDGANDMYRTPGGLPARKGVPKLLEEDDDGQPQSLNPFAKNFVPPESLPGPRSLPHHVPSTSCRPAGRTSLVLRLHVLGDNLISRELLGDATIDLIPLLESEGSVLRLNRFKAVERAHVVGFAADKVLAIDTWVALRRTSGQLRVQILFKPVVRSDEVQGAKDRTENLGGKLSQSSRLERSSSETCVRRAADRFMDFPGNVPRSPEGLRSPRARAETAVLRTNIMQSTLPHRSKVGMPGGRQGDRTACHSPSCRPDGVRVGLWPQFDRMASEGRVVVSACTEHGELDGRLLGIQEQFDFSAASGYREGKPDEDGFSDGSKTRADASESKPEWPRCALDAARLQRDMQLGAWQARSQSIGEGRTV